MSGGVITLTACWGDAKIVIDPEAWRELALPLLFHGEQPQAFFLPRAASAPVRAGSFVGSVAEGGAVNCAALSMTPHGNGTHTESQGHVTRQIIPVGPLAPASWLGATALSVRAERLGDTAEDYAYGDPDDRVVTRAALMSAHDALPAPPGPIAALIISVDPEGADPQTTVHSGQRPAYFTTEAMAWIVAQGIDHLLCSLPSVDREEDQGALPNHRAFWRLAPGATTPNPDTLHKTITELIDPRVAAPGHHLLDLHIPRWDTDAAPSRPRVLPL